ncbi:9777_t:CDS:1, partial [Cetraspora pellucida]
LINTNNITQPETQPKEQSEKQLKEQSELQYYFTNNNNFLVEVLSSENYEACDMPIN